MWIGPINTVPLLGLFYIIWLKRICRVVLTPAGYPFKGRAFSLGGHRRRNQWDLLLLAWKKADCCAVSCQPTEVASSCWRVPSWQQETKQGSQSYSLKEWNLVNNLNELRSEVFPQSLQKGMQPGWPWAENPVLLCMLRCLTYRAVCP